MQAKTLVQTVLLLKTIAQKVRTVVTLDTDWALWGHVCQGVEEVLLEGWLTLC